MSPDDVVGQAADKGTRISVNILDDLIVIEGESEALLMLSDLLAAHARGKDCGFQISPAGAGSALFTDKSTHGLYLHRTGACSH